MAVGSTDTAPPVPATVYAVPFDPVTFTDAAFEAFMVSVSACPEEMLLELAVMATIGVEALLPVAARIEDGVAMPSKGRTENKKTETIGFTKGPLWCRIWLLSCVMLEP